MKGSAITGPVGKEAAELWPVRSLSYSCNNIYPNYFCSVLPLTLVSSCKGLSFGGFMAGCSRYCIIVHSDSKWTHTNKLEWKFRCVRCVCDMIRARSTYDSYIHSSTRLPFRIMFSQHFTISHIPTEAFCNYDTRITDILEILWSNSINLAIPYDIRFHFTAFACSLKCSSANTMELCHGKLFHMRPNLITNTFRALSLL